MENIGWRQGWGRRDKLHVYSKYDIIKFKQQTCFTGYHSFRAKEAIRGIHYCFVVVRGFYYDKI